MVQRINPLSFKILKRKLALTIDSNSETKQVRKFLPLRKTPTSNENYINASRSIEVSAKILKDYL